jgi:type II secretory pathway pseudopilin PulG
MDRLVNPKNRRTSEAGITMIELLMAGTILVITSMGMIGLIVSSIATNNRNKIDSTQTMLAGSILEQINSTLIGSGTSTLTDCAGTTWTINTVPGGAALSGSGIDFTQTSPPAEYYMSYTLNTPCTSTGARQGIYDVRWHVDVVGAPSTPTTTYLLTVGARLQNHGEGNLLFSLPVTLRVMSGN